VCASLAGLRGSQLGDQLAVASVSSSLRSTSHGTFFHMCVPASALHLAVPVPAARMWRRRVYIPLPDVEARKQILKHYLGDRLDASAGMQQAVATCAEATDGYSGADLRLLCKEAAMNPLRGLLKELEGGAKVGQSFCRSVVDTRFLAPLSLARCLLVGGSKNWESSNFLRQAQGGRWETVWRGLSLPCNARARCCLPATRHPAGVPSHHPQGRPRDGRGPRGSFVVPLERASVVVCMRGRRPVAPLARQVELGSLPPTISAQPQTISHRRPSTAQAAESTTTLR
jgi:SpoVK/Ycf46/Vps4 family AAA+-type ATPase